jgi:hypothetical protein
VEIIEDWSNDTEIILSFKIKEIELVGLKDEVFRNIMNHLESGQAKNKVAALNMLLTALSEDKTRTKPEIQTKIILKNTHKN